MVRLVLVLVCVLALSAVLAERRPKSGRRLALQGRSARGGQVQLQRLTSARAGRARQRGGVRAGRQQQGGRRGRRKELGAKRSRSGAGRRAGKAAARGGRRSGRRFGRQEAVSQLYGAPSDAIVDSYGAPGNQIGFSDQSGYGSGAASDDSTQYEGSGSRSGYETKSGFPNWADRCGEGCEGEPVQEVCGSDGKTYPNSCELEYFSCRKYWDIQEVSQGPCESTCPGVEIGMYSGFGVFRATNKGGCNHDFFRCCKAAREMGLDGSEIKSCCNQRYIQCNDFVSSKPWKAGVERFGR